ncbi:MAG: aminodeoxychorismate lyase, partial [Alphaproteobacteria bacterium]|nr:aminodeoxychorismate lyase [Alphaproteobacteria bacterium]
MSEADEKGAPEKPTDVAASQPVEPSAAPGAEPAAAAAEAVIPEPASCATAQESHKPQGEAPPAPTPPAAVLAPPPVPAPPAPIISTLEAPLGEAPMAPVPPPADIAKTVSSPPVESAAAPPPPVVPPISAKVETPDAAPPKAPIAPTAEIAPSASAPSSAAVASAVAPRPAPPRAEGPVASVAPAAPPPPVASTISAKVETPPAAPPKAPVAPAAEIATPAPAPSSTVPASATAPPPAPPRAEAPLVGAPGPRSAAQPDAAQPSSDMYRRRATLQGARQVLQPQAAPAPPPKKRKKRREGTLSMASGFLSFVLVALVAGAFGLVAATHKLKAPGPLAADKVVYIPPRSDLVEIVSQLEREGVIANPALMQLGLLLEGKLGKLKPGEYGFKKNVSLFDVIDQIACGRQIMHSVTIPEGLTSEQIVQKLKEADLLAGDVADLPKEGALLPETYKFPRGFPRARLIAKMQEDQRKTLEAIWAKRAPDLPLRTPF